jgi:hypothetical protein
MPLPMEVDCYVKVFVPVDLTWDISTITANGLFQAKTNTKQLSPDDYELRMSDTSVNGY